MSFKDNVLGDAYAKSITTPNAVIGTRGTNGWIPFTPTISASTTAPTFGSGLVTNASYQVVGKTMDIVMEFLAVGAGSAGSGQYTFPLPAGYRAVSNLGAPVGVAFITANSARVLASVSVNASDGGRSLFLVITQLEDGTLNQFTTVSSTAGRFGTGGTNVFYGISARFEIRN